ncbi:MAG: ABC transporter ATP-binding protein [Saccharofermentanales bacterium]|jgi:ABC-type nitrate/sulfonate/bicarbonate transport system ATPase subunit
MFVYRENETPILKIKGISKAFDGKPVLRDLNLELFHGEIISLLGTSGSGKTTLFNIIAGILEPDQGRIYLNGEDITGETGHLAYMLQKDLLLPHLTILDNVGLPLRIRGKNKSEARAEALQLIPKFGLAGYEKLYPAQLSGGMAQRAAFLRTYLFSSEVALLDEPFSALDALTKEQVQSWYIEMMQKLELSTIFITHDIDEAIRLSDRILILQFQTQNIQQQIIVDSKLRKLKDFTLRPEFLEYKKQILQYLAV